MGLYASSREQVLATCPALLERGYLKATDGNVSVRAPGTWRFEAKGIPFGATARTREVYPNDLKALRRKLIENKALGGTAAVIVEPIGLESGTRPVPFEFNARVRELCDEFGALLIFDKVVSGFRLGLGGGAGILRRAPRSDHLRQVHHRRLPDSRRRRRPPRRDAELCLRHRRQERRAGICGRHAECQSAELRRRLLRDHRDGADQRARDRRPGRRPSHRRPLRYHPPLPPAVRGLQPGLDRSPRDLGRDAPRPQSPAPSGQRAEAAQAHAKGDGRGLHGERRDHPRRLAAVFTSART